MTNHEAERERELLELWHRRVRSPDGTGPSGLRDRDADARRAGRGVTGGPLARPLAPEIAPYPNVEWLGSPNYSSGSEWGRSTIDMAVLHTMVGTIASANSRFQNPDERASAHFGISATRRVQWVDLADIAWHAGNWPVNVRSIGFEHEDGGDYDGPRPHALYDNSSELLALVAADYPIPLVLIDLIAPGCVPHRAVYATACPDALDVARIVAQAREGSMPITEQQQRILDKLATREDVVFEMIDRGDTVKWLLQNLGTIVDRANEGHALFEAFKNAFGSTVAALTKSDSSNTTPRG
jgi:hypothetical protein